MIYLMEDVVFRDFVLVNEFMSYISLLLIENAPRN